jgi:hypothetical protein
LLFQEQTVNGRAPHYNAEGDEVDIRNPLDDDDYDGNDDQIDDLKDTVRELTGLLEGICDAVAEGKSSLKRLASAARKRLKTLEVTE